MHYYMYEIKNNINGKIYVGVHKTKVEDDGYMGSGKVIKAAIKKYGIDNFTKIILERFDTQVEMFEREKEVVNEEFLIRPDVYNLRRGGHGGFDHVNKILTKEDRSRHTKNVPLPELLFSKERQCSPEARARGIELRRQRGEDIGRSGREAAKNEYSAEKRKNTLREICHSKGVKNSQYGTMWITDGDLNKKIKKDFPIPEGWRKGRACIMGV